MAKPEKKKKKKRMTVEQVGNQHGLLCPKCESGQDLSIEATIHVKARLSEDGTDDDGGDTEWDDDNAAGCGACGWTGKVADLHTVEITD